MKRLLILRHAKAGPHDEKRDKQRPLIARGRDDAARIGRAMQEKGYVPNLVLCSSAKRTAETWENVAPAFDSRPETEFPDSLYDAVPATILKCVRAIKQDAAVILVIGHNPGLERFAQLLVRNPRSSDEQSRATALAEKYPTSALVVLDFDIAKWADLESSTGTFVDFLTPARLKSK